MGKQQVFLNGEILPLSQAKVSVLDRGFLFGDGVYEVIPAYGGHLFRFDEHMRRLLDSLQGIGMRPPLSVDKWRSIMQRLLLQGSGDQYIYLQITRGADSIRDHAIPAEITPTVFAMAAPISTQGLERVRLGISAITVEDIRWQLCNIKAITLLSNVLLKQRATNEGVTEAIMIREGQAVEGTASNLFIVTNGLLITPPKSRYLLPGITRDLVLELAKQAAIPFTEATIDMTELEHADEIWLTSSTKEIMPVTQLNGQPVGDGRPGPMWQRISALYQQHKERLQQGMEE